MKLLARIFNALFAVFKSRSDTTPLTGCLTLRLSRTGYVRPDMADFFVKIRPFAVEIETRGIPWTFAAVQAGHESRWGLSKLTVEANNLFGITGDTWAQQGKPVYEIVTKEFAKDGTPFEIRRPFRKYADWGESLRDWAGLLDRRYPDAIKAAKLADFNAFARALQAGGYATDPKYAQKLTDLNNSIGGLV